MSIEKIMATVLPKIIAPKERHFKEWLIKEKAKRHFYIGLLDPDKNTYVIELWQKVNGSHSQKIKDVFAGNADVFISDIINNISKPKENE